LRALCGLMRKPHWEKAHRRLEFRLAMLNRLRLTAPAPWPDRHARTRWPYA
jgi:hypothetical protein